MKTLITVILAATVSACSTSACLVKGLGEDINAGTDWTASKIKSN